MDWAYNASAFGGNYSAIGGDYSDIGPMGAGVFFVIAILIILLQLRERRVRIWTIWIVPALLLLVTAAVTVPELGRGPVNLLIIAVGFAIGCAVGLFIGSRMEVRLDDKGRIVLKGSVIAVLVWIAVLGLKLFGKGAIGSLGIIDFDVLASAVLAMTLSTMVFRRVYVLWKYLQIRKTQAQTVSTIISK